MEKVKERLFYIDNLRLMVIVFVVMHHLAVTYSGFGSFYYIESKPLDLLTTVWFAFYLSFQQGYFMGLLFMIAGYFVAGSYDRKGFGRFAGDRFKRLIIPTLIYMVVITPFIGLVELGQQPKRFDIYGFLSGTGVMWFTAALFIFSLFYGVVRLILRRPASVSNSDGKQIKPSLANAVILILIISTCAFLIRIIQPIGTDILNMQLCFFGSYTVLFIMGILAYRSNLFSRISYKSGKRWLIWSIVLGLLSWLVLVSAAKAAPGGTAALSGGLTWESAGYSLWESFVAVAMSIGLIAVFREKFNYQSRLVKTLSDNSFAVYMFHPPILVAVTLLFSPVALSPVVKWVVLCIICVPLCFVATQLVFRKIPLLKNVL
jgi:fucose 4-O-acetylase-like acetyltransferase